MKKGSNAKITCAAQYGFGEAGIPGQVISCLSIYLAIYLSFSLSMYLYLYLYLSIYDIYTCI